MVVNLQKVPGAYAKVGFSNSKVLLLNFENS
jgi:hypothetical protein